MKNIGNILIGFLIGIMFTITVNAAVKEYVLKQSECKIVVDGVEVKGELPLLIMEPGFNYIPAAEFRSICDKIGIGFEFDVPTKEIRIATQKTQPLSAKGVDNVSEVVKTPDGLNVILYEGKYYVRWGELRDKSESLGLSFRIKDGIFYFLQNYGTVLCSLPLHTVYSTNDSATLDDYIYI